MVPELPAAAAAVVAYAEVAVVIVVDDPSKHGSFVVVTV